MSAAILLLCLSVVSLMGLMVINNRRLSARIARLEGIEDWRAARRASAIATADRAREWATKGLPIDEPGEYTQNGQADAEGLHHGTDGKPEEGH